MALPDEIDEVADRSAAPALVRTSLERLIGAHDGLLDRLDGDRRLLDAVVAVCGASRSLTVLLVADARAIDQLACLDVRPLLVDSRELSDLVGWKRLELLRIAARDLLGLDDLETTTSAISALARDVLDESLRYADATQLSVIGMGKLGGDELNYASDIDVMFVGEGDVSRYEKKARQVMEHGRTCFRIDANLRPQGRDGVLVRTVDSYAAYWERWAEPWEYQALLKAVPVAGAPELGSRFDAERLAHLWGRTFSADDLRSLRTMKARTEGELARRGLADREIKRGWGGIRDVEFALQLLQLVHGRRDEPLRSPTTLTLLREMAQAGYVDPDDADALADAYRFLRAIEHRLQLVDEQQEYALPKDAPSLERLARTMGFRDTGASTSIEQFELELTRHRSTVRSIHERLYFRPLLEVFAGADSDVLSREGAVEERLAAFGFADALRTRAAIKELTRGLTRSSRLMQQMLPLLLDWLSQSPDPDLGLLCLRNLASGRERSDELARTFRDAPEAARRLCIVCGTSRLVATALQQNPDLIVRLADEGRLRTQARSDLVESARRALAWREDVADQQAALRRWKERHLVGVQVRDLLGLSDVRVVEANVTALAEAVVEVAVEQVQPSVPFAVIALGRFGGAELSYASDLDVVFVYDGEDADDFRAAERSAQDFRRFVGGAVGADRIWEVDCDLRPEGRQGMLARSIEGYRQYFEVHALTWERQAMSRARVVAGDAEVGARFMALLDDFVWDRGLADEDVREMRRIKARVEKERIPATDNPEYHLKLGRGSLSDVEFTVQMLQLRHGIREPSTMGALDALLAAGVMSPDHHAILAEAYRFCEQTRNRLYLVKSGPSNSLPQQPEQLRWLARAMDTTPNALKDHYRKLTRRSRWVVERLFYGRT